MVNDWISGGTGSDGILGDDGRIVTSRNSITGEPLSGVAAIPSGSLNLLITTPGKIQQATINVTGELKKTVNLTPFNVDKSNNPLFDANDADDLLFGGLGDDFIHGGVGDDGILGGEALLESYALNASLTGVIRSDYTRPYNPGDLLRFNANGYDERRPDRTLRAGEFALYDEYDPLRKILIDPLNGQLSKNGTGVEWLLNFNPTEGVALGSGFFSDGEDAIFGDLGNDWAVGGTGRDNLYGGYGNDLLNTDDDQGTESGLNNVPDTHVSYEDRAYGGAGRDVLIANTGGDRLIDWAGEFNSYLVPFAPFGMATVSRALQPQISEFLYALSASDGADPTRAFDTGTDPLRNGEPDGELGLVRQQDPDWQDQTGAPTDIQPGNIPGGRRDVLRSASFNDGQMQGFAPDSGSFSVSGGTLKVTATSNSGDAVAVYHQAEALPGYFELSASIRVDKPTAGWKANAYMIFDYQSPTDFKFTGLDVSTNKLVMGHRDASGWIIDKQAAFPGSVKYGSYYNMLVAVNGTTATLVVDNKNVFTHTFAARIIDGVTYGLNWGLVGVGSDKSRGLYDNVTVQVLPPAVTYQSTSEFTTSEAPVFGGGTLGVWALSSGKYSGTPAAGQSKAMSLANIGVNSLKANSWLELSGKVITTKSAGFVFDRYSDDDFKFVMIDVEADRILIGHHTARTGFIIDASAVRTLAAGVENTVTLTLKGSTASVAVNGSFGASFAYNALTIDGRFGLLARDASALFDSVTVKTDDSAFPSSAQSLLASAAPSSSQTNEVAEITSEMIAPVLAEAKRRWAVSGLLDATELAKLDGINVQIGSFGGLILGQENDSTITIDTDAAGWGWFVDPTSAQNEEYHRMPDGSLRAKAQSDAYGRMDLLTVLGHEIGHALGYTHADAVNGQAELMDAVLAAGVRELPVSKEAGSFGANVESISAMAATAASTGVSYFDADTGAFVKADQPVAVTAKKDPDEFLVVMDQGSNKPRHELFELVLADDKGVTSVPPLVHDDESESLATRLKKMAARIKWK